MKIKILFLFLFFIFLSSCNQLEFVYENHELNKTLNNKVRVFAKGDESALLLNYFKDKMGNANENAKYKLDIFSSKYENNLITEKDGSTSKLEINYKVKYELKQIEDNCLVYKKIIVTSSIYNSKSSGYNFGSDVSKKEIVLNNLSNNINDFIKHLSANEKFLECPNENKP